MRAIDADKLGEVKFHSLPYTHITPSDVEAESYKRGWNDAIDSIIEDAPTIEPERKKGRWRRRLVDSGFNADWHCSECGWKTNLEEHGYNFCPNCGARLEGENETD